jgi:hypothetical protein
MCQSFPLIDLTSQRKAVKRYVEDWTPDEILNWLTNYGTVIEFSTSYGKQYTFHSQLDLGTSFYFDELGELMIQHIVW